MKLPHEKLDGCPLPILREHAVPPHGPRLNPLTIQTEYQPTTRLHKRVQRSPLRVKFQALARKWLPALESLWKFGPVEVLLESDGSVSTVAASEGEERAVDFHRILRHVPSTAQQFAWQLFCCFSERGTNQFSRRVSYEPLDVWLRREDITKSEDFLRALTWLRSASSPGRVQRKEVVPLISSRRLASLIDNEIARSGAASLDYIDRAMGAMNSLLAQDTFLDHTRFHDIDESHLQVTASIARKAALLLQNTEFSRTKSLQLMLRRIWLEALFHSPEPPCSEEHAQTGNQPLTPVIQPLRLTPFVTDTFCALPIYISKSSRLLGMICLHGEASDESRWPEVRRIGGLTDAFIVDSIRDNLLLIEGSHRLKAARTDSQVADVINYLAETLIGANDNCLQFRDQKSGVIRCAQANCQYQQVDFGPGFGVDVGAGTVYDNLFDDEIDGEIIDDLMIDRRHLNACEKFVVEHGTTFYDRSSLNVKMRHADNPGIAVLQHQARGYYSEVDFVELDALLKIAEMRLDELVAEGYRSFLQTRRSEIPLSSAIYRELLYNLDGEGVASFLQGRLSKEFDVIALVAKVGHGLSTCVAETDRFKSTRDDSLLARAEFTHLVATITDNQDLLRAVWTDPGGTLWCDQFYNSRFPEKLDSSRLARAVPPSRLVLWKPLSVTENVFLWLERDLNEEEGASFDLFVNDIAWWDLESAFRDLESAITANWAATLNRNALRGVLARPLHHNIGKLLIEAVAAVKAVKSKATADTDRLMIENLGYAAVVDSVSALHHAIRSFAAIVRPTKLERTASRDVVRRLLNQLQAETRQSKIEVYCEPPDTECDCFVDVDQLRFAFRELLNNTKDEFGKVAPTERRVWLTGRESNGWFQLIYEDSGGGIDSSQREWVFGSEATTKSSGTGLGLFIVRSLVLANQGRVYVGEPDPSRRGARFVMEFPIKG